MDTSRSNEADEKWLQLPDDLEGWEGREPEVIPGERVVVILQERINGRVVGDVGGNALDLPGALAMAIENAREYMKDHP